MLPWVGRNLATFHHPVTLSDQLPTTLAAANNPSTYAGPAHRVVVLHLRAARYPLPEERRRVGRRRLLGGEGTPLRRGTSRPGLRGRDRAGRPRVGSVRTASRQASEDFLETWPVPVSEAWLIWFYPMAALAIAGGVILRRRREPVYPLVAMVVVTTLTALATYGKLPVPCRIGGGARDPRPRSPSTRIWTWLVGRPPQRC